MIINSVIGEYIQPGRVWFNRNQDTVTHITIHHDAIPHANKTARQVMEQIYRTHVNNGWPGMSYHYYIHTDGEIYQVNQNYWVTWHDTKNYDSIAVLLTGYFHPPYNNKPTAKQLSSLQWLLDYLQEQKQRTVVGHRQRSATACCGDNFMPWVLDYKRKENMATMLQYLGLPTDSEAQARLKEHLGEFEGKCDWGNSAGTRGGHLGAERRKNADLTSKLATANAEIARLNAIISQSPSPAPITGSVPETMNINGNLWKLNGINRDPDGKLHGNYAR